MWRGLFEHAYVINLQERPDRLLEVQQHLHEIGMPSDLITYYRPKRDPRGGERGCYRSHQAIIRLAQSKGYRRIGIFEDDVMFAKLSDLDHTCLSICVILFQAQEDLLDIFYLGHNPTIMWPIQDNIYQTRSRTTHAYILNLHGSMAQEIARTRFSGTPIDVIYEQRAKSWALKPMIAFQRYESKSDITPFMDRWKQSLADFGPWYFQFREFLASLPFYGPAPAPALSLSRAAVPWLEVFDHAYCINLQDRPDRRIESREEFARVGILPHLTYYHPVRDPKGGVRGCYESHREVIRLGRVKKYRYIGIFEDDVVFRHPIFWPRLQKANSEFRGIPEADLFFLGHLPTNMWRVSESLFQTSSLCAHAYIIRLDSPLAQFVAETPYSGLKIDSLYEKYASSYTFKPMICDQRYASTSDATPIFNWVRCAPVFAQYFKFREFSAEHCSWMNRPKSVGLFLVATVLVIFLLKRFSLRHASK